MKSLRARLFNAKALTNSWFEFRPDFKPAPTPGIDGIDFDAFDLAAKSQVSELAEEIANGSYYHRELRASFISKSGSLKKRCINVPTLRDRLGAVSASGGELLPVSRTPGLGVLVRSESDDGTAQGVSSS